MRCQADLGLPWIILFEEAKGRSPGSNWLFMGDAQSGHRAATVHTLIDHCHRPGLDATAYLTDIFTRLPSETNQIAHRLTPKAWAADQAAPRQAVAQTCVAVI